MDQEAAIGVDELEPIFAMLDGCKHLRELGLPNLDCDQPRVFAAIAKHAFAKQLEVIDLSWGDLDTDDGAALSKLVAKAPALRELRLEGTAISASAKKAIKAPKVELVGKPVKGNQRYRYIVTME
jgi:hypothetical protein